MRRSDGLILMASASSCSASTAMVQALVKLNQDDAFVPDLAAIEVLVAETLAQAA